jgi:hypothetical protein
VTSVVGVYSRTGTAEAVALSVSGPTASSVAYRGRWSLDLIADRADRQIYHSVADLPLARAETMVSHTIDVVTDIAVNHLRSIIGSLGAVDVVGVVVGDYPVPDSLAAILSAHTLMHAAEGALFRDAFLDAATTCGVPAIGVSRNQATAWIDGEYADVVAAVGQAAGRPWRKDHKLAMVGAIAAARASRTRPSRKDRPGRA